MSSIIINEKNINKEVYPLIDEIKLLLREIKTDNFLLEGSLKLKIEYRLIKNVFYEIDEITDAIYKLENKISDKLYEAHVIQKRIQDNPNYNLVYGPQLPSYLYTPLTLSTSIYDELENIQLIDKEMPNYVKYDFFTGIEKNVEGVLDNLEKCLDKYIYGDKFKNYKKFKKCLLDKAFVSKPCRDTSYATQGVCEIGNMTLITSYDTGFQKGKKNKQSLKYSRLDIVGVDGEVKTLYFPHTAHVGGIGYSDDREMIYVCGDGKVEYYSIEQLANAIDGTTIFPIGKYEFAPKEGKGNNSINKASFLTTHKNNVWVGEFQYKKDFKNGSNPELMRYTTDELGNMIDGEMFTLPWRNVQGMCVTEYEGKEYYIFSTSEGRRKDSHLRVCVLENGEFVEKGKITMPCLSEQVSLTESGDLMIIFESDCDKYGEGADNKGCATKQVGNVCYLDIEEVMSRCI